MRLGGAGCGVRHQGPFAIAEPRRSDAVSLRSARAALDAAQKTRGKVGVSGENGVGSGGSLAGNENKILVSAGITATNIQKVREFAQPTGEMRMLRGGCLNY